MANFLRLLPFTAHDGHLKAATVSCKRIVNPALALQRLIAMSFGLALLILLPGSLMAQSAADFKIEVLVADQGQKQRSSAYWLALDRVLRRNMPEAVPDTDQRSKVLREASRYVQSFRYRKFNPSIDSGRLSTRTVREGGTVAGVIAVTFPADLETILRQQSAPAAVIEESTTVEPRNILALIAVDQQATQFLIGGERGRKFQTRMAQLGTANGLSFEFPKLDAADTELISPSDVLYDQTDRLDAITSRYDTDRRLSASLFRLSEEVWQTEWRYIVANQAPRTLNLTTRSLDEALVTALSELGDAGTGYRADGYLGQGAAFVREGVGLRVENINSILDYQRVLAILQRVDASFMTESLESGAIVFRAPQASAISLQQTLARVPQLSQLTSGSASGTDLVTQYVGR